jgi:hypothetical protein
MPRRSWAPAGRNLPRDAGGAWSNSAPFSRLVRQLTPQSNPVFETIAALSIVFLAGALHCTLARGAGSPPASKCRRTLAARDRTGASGRSTGTEVSTGASNGAADVVHPRQLGSCGVSATGPDVDDSRFVDSRIPHRTRVRPGWDCLELECGRFEGRFTGVVVGMGMTGGVGSRQARTSVA